MTGDNMKKVNSIRIFCLLAVVVLILAVKFAGHVPDKNTPPETEQLIPVETEKETEKVLIVNQNVDYKYLIIEEGDYLTVYYADRKTVYQYTDIRYSDLDDILRQKIRKGYWIEDEEQLYGFLENYDT